MSVGCSLVGWVCVRHAAQSICSTACLASACPSVCLFASWLSPASPYCLHLSRAFSAAVIHMSSRPAAQDRLLRRGCVHLNQGTAWHKYKTHASLTSRWCTLIFTDTCSNMHVGGCCTSAGKGAKHCVPYWGKKNSLVCVFNNLFCLHRSEVFGLVSELAAFNLFANFMRQSMYFWAPVILCK